MNTVVNASKYQLSLDNRRVFWDDLFEISFQIDALSSLFDWPDPAIIWLAESAIFQASSWKPT